jgi:hypothetical protein
VNFLKYLENTSYILEIRLTYLLNIRESKGRKNISLEASVGFSNVNFPTC